MNVLINHVENIVSIREGNLFEALHPTEQFDLIVGWPPQMPTPPEKERTDWYGLANFGGIDGRKVLDAIILGAKDIL